MSDPTAAPAAKRFAFLVHPRADVASDMARVWRPLGRMPAAAWDWGLKTLPVPPVPLATVHRRDVADGRPAGWVIVVPVGASQLLTEDRRWVIRDRKSTRLNSSHSRASRMPSSA